MTMWIPKPPERLSDAEKEQHPSWRRFTRRYRRKRRIVKNVWILSGLLMIAIPPAAVPLLALGTTFIAFMILDETG